MKPRRRSAAEHVATLACVLACALEVGCAALKPMVASSDDLADYRAFRVAEADGTRLARASAYLSRHPKGSFADELRAAFEDEEPRYFERAQASREGARRYLADLPEGPHAAAALALLTALGSSMQEAELQDIARRVRYEDAKLEGAAVQRRAVGEAILGATGVLLDEAVYGVARTEGPSALGALMLGRTTTTWGTVPSRHEEYLFFVLPTRPERESRLVTVEVTLVEQDGAVTGGRIEGVDMLVMWAEADQITKLDPTVTADRTEAHMHAMERLEGAFEGRFPSASCPDVRAGRELYHRKCDGWEAVVAPGEQAGTKDAIVLRGRRGPARKQPDR